MPEYKPSKLKGNLKYYEGTTKETIGKVINSEKWKKEGEADKLTGNAERDAAIYQDTKKDGNDRRNEVDKEQAKKVVKMSELTEEQATRVGGIGDSNLKNQKSSQADKEQTKKVPKLTEEQAKRVGDIEDLNQKNQKNNEAVKEQAKNIAKMPNLTEEQAGSLGDLHMKNQKSKL